MTVVFSVSRSVAAFLDVSTSLLDPVFYIIRQIILSNEPLHHLPKQRQPSIHNKGVLLMPDLSNLDRKSIVGYSLLGTLIAALALMLVLYCLIWNAALPFFFWLLLVVLLSVVIWKACDPFSEASFFLGRNIPGSVRGATIDAVASSMPEFFTVLFFLIVYRNFGSGTGYSSGIATCAGSAIYNMMVIPAICTFFIFSFRGKKGLNTDLVVEKEVLYRDGLFFLLSEIVLIVFITMGEMNWLMAVVFVGLYLIYASWLWLDAKRHRRRLSRLEKYKINKLCADFHKAVKKRDPNILLKVWPNLPDSEFQEELDEDPDDFWNGFHEHIHTSGPMEDDPDPNAPACTEEGPATTGVINTDPGISLCACKVRAQGGKDYSVDYADGMRSGMLRLNIDQDDQKWNIGSVVKYDHTKGAAWLTILVTTLIVAFTCYFLALSCQKIAYGLGIEPFFVAVVIAAAATSVPDTFLSMLSAKKGDDSGAVSNAFGSNIFDINIGLGIPLLIWTLWKGPIVVRDTGVQEVRIILLVFSAITLVVFAVQMKLNRIKAVILFFLYFLFMIYAFVRGWMGIGLGGIFSRFF